MSARPLSDAVRVVGAAFVLALLPRLAAAWAWPATGGDSAAYATVAENILRNFCVSLSDPASGACVPHWGGNQLPGFPAFMALAWLLFGRGEIPVLVTQAIVNALAVAYLSGAILRFAGSSPAALAAVVVTALSPLTVAWPRFMLTEALSVAATHWVLAEVLLSLSAGRLRVVPLGLALATAIFIRYDNVLLCLTVGMLVPAFGGWGSGLRRATLAALVVATPLGAWWARSVNAGLTPFPEMHSVLEAPPQGFMSWGFGWTVHQHQLGAWAYPVFRRAYSEIRVPAAAHDSDEERFEVESLLRDLSRFDGKAFPAEIDRRFGQLAAAKRRMHPVRQYLMRPLQRSFFMWFNPADSGGWPVDLGASRTLKWDLSTLVDVARSQPAALVVKAGTLLYRVALLVLCIVLLAWRTTPGTRALLWSAFAYAAAQTVLHAVLGGTEVRFLLSACAFLEPVVVLALVHKLSHERHHRI